MSPRSIKQLRLSLKLTQAAAAGLVRVTPNTWARWERGEAKPRGTSQMEGIRNLPSLANRNHAAQHHPGLQHSTARSLLRFAGTWVGDDLEQCLSDLHAWRGRAAF